MTLSQAYPSLIPVGISETNPYLVITVLLLVTIILNIRYIGMIFSFILGVFTLFIGTDYWYRFGLGPMWAQTILILIFIILSIKNFTLSLFKRESILHPLTRDDRYLLTILLTDLTLSDTRKYQAISYWFPLAIFTYFLYIEKSLLSLLLRDPQRTGITFLIGVPILGIIFSLVYFVSITVEEDFFSMITFPVATPSVEILDIYFDCVIYYLMLMVVASIIGWKGFLKYSSIQLISYSFPVVAIVIWRWEIYEVFLILLYYFLIVGTSVILLFLLERAKVMSRLRLNTKHKFSQIIAYIEKINTESKKPPEELSEKEELIFFISQHKNWMNWPKTPSKLKTSLILIVTFVPKKLIALGKYVKSKCLTFKFRPIRQKNEYRSFKAKLVDIYLVPLKYVVFFVLTIPIYAIITYFLYQAISIPKVIILIQTHPEYLLAIIIFVLIIISISYLALLLLYIIFSQWLRKYRTLIVYGEDINWSELTYDCIVEAREYNTRNNIKKAYQYLVLALYYTLMEELEFVEVNILYKIRKGARLYRKKNIEKALLCFDKISKDVYKNESLKHFGHIYDLIGNYYRKQDESSKAIEYFLKSKAFNAKAKNWKNVDIIENKIKELNV